MVQTHLEQRVDRGRNALALARQRGLDITHWERELARLERLQEQADEDYRLTIHLLATQGWCLWQCSALDEEIIALVRDESVKDVPKGYVVYTVAEIEEMGRLQVPQPTIRLVHEIKKRHGATVQSVIARSTATKQSQILIKSPRDRSLDLSETMPSPPPSLSLDGRG